MGEFQQVYEHESKNFLARDFEGTLSDKLPPDIEDGAYSFKVILKGHDEVEDEEGNPIKGDTRFLSTNIYESLEEAMGDAEGLADSYSETWEMDSIIVRVYTQL